MCSVDVPGGWAEYRVGLSAGRQFVRAYFACDGAPRPLELSVGNQKVIIANNKTGSFEESGLRWFAESTFIDIDQPGLFVVRIAAPPSGLFPHIQALVFVPSSRIAPRRQPGQAQNAQVERTMPNQSRCCTAM